tara:strand:- start:1466 stop:2494 length:1029 start_codon:yes stop_codon:yes gene_type:complete
MERSMKVVSATQARLHAALRQEFKILARVIHQNLPEKYERYGVEEFSRVKDFNEKVDVIPVSDPNASTMAQRITQYQAALQLAQQAPQMYDLPVLHRQMLETLGIKDVDKIIPTSSEVKPEEPSVENMNLINTKPVKAFEYQDHQAHITVHMTAMQDPKIQQLVSQSPLAGAIQSATETHIREHLAFEYRKQIEEQLGVSLPPIGDPLPEDIEKSLSDLVSKAADKLLQKDVAEAQAQENMKQMQDPVIQNQMKELELKQLDIQRKAQAEQARLQADMEKFLSKYQLEIQKLETKKEIEGAKIGASIAEKNLDLIADGEKLSASQTSEGVKIGVDIAKNLMP